MLNIESMGSVVDVTREQVPDAILKTFFKVISNGEMARFAGDEAPTSKVVKSIVAAGVYANGSKIIIRDGSNIILDYIKLSQKKDGVDLDSLMSDIEDNLKALDYKAYNNTETLKSMLANTIKEEQKSILNNIRAREELEAIEGLNSGKVIVDARGGQKITVDFGIDPDLVGQSFTLNNDGMAYQTDLWSKVSKKGLLTNIYNHISDSATTDAILNTDSVAKAMSRDFNPNPTSTFEYSMMQTGFIKVAKVKNVIYWAYDYELKSLNSDGSVSNENVFPQQSGNKGNILFLPSTQIGVLVTGGSEDIQKMTRSVEYSDGRRYNWKNQTIFNKVSIFDENGVPSNKYSGTKSSMPLITANKGWISGELTLS